MIGISKYISQTITPKDVYAPAKIGKGGGIYLFSDKKNRLLYIGASSRLKIRIKEHIRGKGWSNKFCHLICNIQIIYPDRFGDFLKDFPKCMDIEYYLILHNQPKFNRMGKKRLPSGGQLKYDSLKLKSHRREVYHMEAKVEAKDTSGAAPINLLCHGPKTYRYRKPVPISPLPYKEFDWLM